MKTLQHQRICLQVYRIVQDLVKLGSWMAIKELDSDFWLFAIITAHWAFLGFNVEKEDGFNSFYMGVGLFLVRDAVFIFTSVLKEFETGQLSGLAFEGHGDHSQANLSGVGQLYQEQDVPPGEEVDQHQVVAGQVHLVHQDAS